MGTFNKVRGNEMDLVKVIVLGTGRATKEFIKKNIKSDLISIVGVVLDTAICEEDRDEFVKDLHQTVASDIEILEFSEESFELSDIIFMPEYRKIIPDRYAQKYIMVNCHGGILPKWRGFAANAWAIMNGEQEIGFSIHRVSSELDGGEIFYVKHIPISEEETYADVHGKMVGAIAKEVPQILYDIVRNNLIGEKQKNAQFAYCTKFSACMGELREFSLETSYYVNLYRCMAKPLGTGVFFYHKGEKIEVSKVEPGKKYCSMDYICMPGKIVNIENERIWVKTKDNVIVFSEMSIAGRKIVVKDYFKNGMNIGGAI